MQEKQINQMEEKGTKSLPVSNPRIQSDSSMESGQKVTWDCVWFGSYPQVEIVASIENYTSVDNEVLKDGDIIENSKLYSALESATGWDSKNEIILDGERYRRMKMEDASATSPLDGYYGWENGEIYHYFRFEPIKWRVLNVGGEQVFLLADKALDAQSYHTDYKDITWENSMVRSWLNESFINSAFSAEQKAVVLDTQVTNANNTVFETNGGSDTKDKIFLLSEGETYGDRASSYGFAFEKKMKTRRACVKAVLLPKPWEWLQIGVTNIKEMEIGGCVRQGNIRTRR